MPTALALSPHLDDAVFSCGGLLALLADLGWHTCMATAFTATRLPTTGFALACQLDKGLPADLDYMALRRAEDRDAAGILGVSDLRHLDLPEAPHRGYESAAALFGALREGDEVWRPLAAMIGALADELRPALVLAPQGLGGHVDHRQLIRAVLEALPPRDFGSRIAWYRDTPYAIRDPEAAPDPAVPPLPEACVRLGPAHAGVRKRTTLGRKIAAACAYRSQVGFQFGGADAAGAALRSFAVAEGNGLPAERLLGLVTWDIIPPPGTSHSPATL